MAEQNRMSRALETREKEARPIKRWTPAELLPHVDHEPGFNYRWVRTAIGGKSDAKNISSKFREGWEPVKASAHPEAWTFSEATSRFKDAIEVGDLILCKQPIEISGQRDQYFQEIADNQMSSIDNSFMRASDSRMPLFNERKSTVTKGSAFGSGS
jgi:hypothetical protein